ncbi:MAG: tetratricopeptide repeat protein [Pseudomonadota bacterium]
MITTQRALPKLLAAVSLLIIAACENDQLKSRSSPLKDTVIDDAGLNDLLLTSGDPEFSIEYFETAVAREPERSDFRRGLAISYARAKRYPEASRVYEELIALDQAQASDVLEYGFVAVRLGEWEAAESASRQLPSGFNQSRRHLLSAMIADSKEQWEAADASYTKAETLALKPDQVLNNWGVSYMARGDLDSAERTFKRAVSFNSRLFSAKNNLAIVRGMQGDFTLPLVPMTDQERAMILNNLGVIATRQGETKIARGLFAAAVDSHPQHYQGAADKLAALDGKVEN